MNNDPYNIDNQQQYNNQQQNNLMNENSSENSLKNNIDSNNNLQLNNILNENSTENIITNNINDNNSQQQINENNSENIITNNINDNNLITYQDHKNMSSINIINESYSMWDLDNLFSVFKSEKGRLYLVHSKKNSLICFDLLDEKEMIKIRKAHRYFIINLRHTYDISSKRDLILSISGEDNNAKIWDFEKWECIFNKNVNTYGIMFSSCFLYDNNTRTNYLVTSNCTGSEYIKIFDLNGNKIKDVPFHEDKEENDNEDNNIINNNSEDHNIVNEDNNNIENEDNNIKDNNENGNININDINDNNGNNYNNYLDNNDDFNNNENNNNTNSEQNINKNYEENNQKNNDDINYNNVNNTKNNGEEENKCKNINNEDNKINNIFLNDKTNNSKNNMNTNENGVISKDSEVNIIKEGFGENENDYMKNKKIENSKNSEEDKSNDLNNKLESNFNNKNNENLILENRNDNEEMNNNLNTNNNNENTFFDNNNSEGNIIKNNSENDNLNYKENNEEDNISNNSNISNDIDINQNNNNNSNIKSYDDIYFIDTYYDKPNNTIFIIACCSKFVKSFNYNSNTLYQIYQDNEKESSIHSSAVVTESENIVKLIDSCMDGYIRIWDFHQNILLKRIKISDQGIKGICLWDESHIFVGCDEKCIKLVQFNDGNIENIMFGHKGKVCCVKQIYHERYGKCLVSKGWGLDVIKLWVNNESV